MFIKQLVSIVWFFLVNCFCLNTVKVKGQTCNRPTDKLDTFSNPCGYCGICKTTSKSQYQGNCDYHYLETSGLFLDTHSSPQLCVLKNHCENNKTLCKSDSIRFTGVCFPLFGTYLCECKAGFFGKNCENIADLEFSNKKINYDKKIVKHLAVVHNVVFTPIFYYPHFATILISLQSIGSNLSIHIDNGREKLKYNEQICEKGISTKKFCQDLFNDIENTKICEGKYVKKMKQPRSKECLVTLKFPFPRSYDKKRAIHQYTDEVGSADNPIQGNLETVTVEIQNDFGKFVSKKIFEYTFKIIHIHKSTLDSSAHCVPKVRLINCGESMANMPSISRYIDLFILGSIDNKIPAGSVCQENDNINSFWKVWKIHENHDELKEAPVLNNFKNNMFMPSEKKLDYGVYKVQLTVRTHFISETAYCYFKIIRTPIQTTILGGSMRTIHYKNPIGIRFDISSSVIPDRYSLDTGMKVIYNWRCNDLNEQFCKPFPTSDTKRIIRGPFQESKTYNFTVNTKVTQQFGIGLVIEHPETQVIRITSRTVLNLAIICLKNCGGSVFKTNPQEIVLLEVLRRQSIKNENVSFYWKYKCLEDNVDFQDVITIKDKDSSQSKLLIDRNKLKEGRKCVFRVAEVDSVSLTEIVIETDKSPKEIFCEVFPKNGTKGETKFRVSCNSWLKEDGLPSLIYEFYDRYENEPIGRMVGYSTTGIIAEIMLTRDQFFVRATNFFGTATESLVNVKLSAPVKKFSPSLIESEYELKNKDYIYRMGSISAYSDLLDSQSFWSDEMQTLLDLLTKEEAQPKDIMGALLLKNALFITACNKLIAFVKETNIFYCESIQSIVKIMHRVTASLYRGLLQNNTNCRLITTARIKVFVDSILNCSNFVFEANFHTVNVHSNSIDVHECLKDSTYYMIHTLDDLAYIAALQIPLIKKQKFQSENIVLLVQEVGSDLDDSVITVSLDFTKIRLQEGYKYYIQQVIYNRNPYWWGSGRKINTNVYSFQLNRGNKHIKNPDFGRIVHFHLKVIKFQSLLVQGSVRQPDPQKKPELNDFEVVVYRIDPETYSETFIEFVNFIGKADIKVLILKAERPDFNMMTVKATEVTQLSRKWSFGKKDKKRKAFYYMGILPGPQVNIGISVNYSFTLFSARCAVWKYKSWISGEKCAVNSSSDMNKQLLVCSCTLLNLVIGGYVYSPIISLNPFLDLYLFLKISENTITVSLLLITFLVFLMMLIWTKKKDKEDKKRKNVLVLEDNNMNDSYIYLIAVFTGSRFGAGTTSNVGIKLFGEMARSRTVIFSSSHQPILQCGADDWFLLSTPKHFGQLLHINLWIDYRGLFPNWFCRKVTVCDLKSSEKFSFIVEKWFGINMNDVCVELVTKGAASHEVNTFRLIFFHNLVQGLREFHIFLSIFFKHPRSLISRTERLSIFLCCVLVAMASTTLLYSLSTPIFEDYSVYDIKTKTIVISFISSLTGTVVGLITAYYFRNSYTIIGSKFLTRSEINLNNKTKCKSDTQNKFYFLKLLHAYTGKYVSSCKIIPIGNIDNTMGLKENKSIKNLAWMICLAIIFVSVYIVIMSSLTYGEIKRSLWLTSLLLTGLIDFYFLVPMKVFLTAVYLSLLKIRYFDLMLHNIAVSKFLEYVKVKKYKKVNENYEKVRMFSIYSYMSWHENCYGRVKKRQRTILKIWVWVYTLEALILIGVMMLVMVEFETTKNFYINTAICKKMMTEKLCANVLDEDLTFFTLRFNVHEYMLPKLYETKWYNGDAMSSIGESPFQDKGWMLNANSRLIGDPHLIQVRVRKNLCTIPKIMLNLTRTCFPSLSSSTVDSDNYSLSWTHDDWTEIELFTESPWEFVQGSGIGVRTPSNYYLKDGGYVATLLQTLDAAKLVYTNLIDTNWIDGLTRVVVLEFASYNVNNNMITSSYLVTEMYPTVKVKVSFTIRSLSNYYHKISFQSILFILLSLYFLIRTLVLINIMGVGNFFKSLWDCFDLFFSILYLVATVKYVYLLYLLRKDERKSDSMLKNRHVYLEMVFQAVQDSIIYICYTFGVAAIRLIRITQINDNCKTYLSNLVKTRNELLLTVAISFSSMFIMFRLVMYYIEPPTVYDFMDILVFQSDFHSFEEQYDTITGKLSAYALGRLSDIAMFSFTITLLHHQRQVTLRRISLIKT